MENSRTRNCSECQKTFSLNAGRGGHGRLFCSPACRRKTQYRAAVARDPEAARAVWKARSAARRQSDPDEFRRYQTEYRKKNRESLVQKRHEAYLRDRETIRAKNKAWGEQNREKMREYFRGRHRAAQVASPWKTLFFSARQRARTKGFTFTITEEWARERWTGRCEVTGLEFVLDQRGAGPKFWSPSIDRVDNSRGYEPDNCRFVLNAFNQLKGTGTDADAFRIAKGLAENMKVKSP